MISIDSDLDEWSVTMIKRILLKRRRRVNVASLNSQRNSILRRRFKELIIEILYVLEDAGVGSVELNYNERPTSFFKHDSINFHRNAFGQQFLTRIGVDCTEVLRTLEIIEGQEWFRRIQDLDIFYQNQRHPMMRRSFIEHQQWNLILDQQML